MSPAPQAVSSVDEANMCAALVLGAAKACRAETALPQVSFLERAKTLNDARTLGHYRSSVSPLSSVSPKYEYVPMIPRAQGVSHPLVPLVPTAPPFPPTRLRAAPCPLAMPLFCLLSERVPKTSKYGGWLACRRAINPPLRAQPVRALSCAAWSTTPFRCPICVCTHAYGSPPRLLRACLSLARRCSVLFVCMCARSLVDSPAQVATLAYVVQ